MPTSSELQTRFERRFGDDILKGLASAPIKDPESVGLGKNSRQSPTEKGAVLVDGGRKCASSVLFPKGGELRLKLDSNKEICSD